MATSKSSDADKSHANGVSMDKAFSELRPQMIGLAYRITGSRAEAEDIVQDAFLRLHDSEPNDPIRSVKAYLATITARLSLNRLRDMRAHRESYVGEWLPEPILAGDEPGLRAEDVSFALMVVLERLAPIERVIFVLHNAFDLSFEEIGEIVGRNAAACRKAFSRARERVLAERPRFEVNRARHRAVVKSFLEAARGQDIAQMVALLDENVTLHGDGGGKAFAIARPIVGAENVARFILAVTGRRVANTQAELTEINGMAGLVVKAGGRVIVAIMVESDGERITRIFGVSNPDKLSTPTRREGMGNGTEG
jgi:RNA polymerase sigma-70 factor (ECF subfamily)